MDQTITVKMLRLMKLHTGSVSQGSIRDENPRHDFDYDHEDDWLGTD